MSPVIHNCMFEVTAVLTVLVLRLKAFTALLLVVILWSSSFPVIKIVVGDIGGYRYTWVRGLFALLVLTPLAIHRVKPYGFNKKLFYGGLLTGVSYTLGLWFQGVGTGLTTASNSAFITGLNVVFVHIYVALTRKRYELILGLELLLAMAGLYLLTSPSGRIGLGDLLVFISSFFWAGQVILVSRYAGDPIVFTWAEMIPSLSFILPDILFSNELTLSIPSLLGLAYLGIICSATAFALQVYGQKYIAPEIAAITYLLEPVFASIFSHYILGEFFTTIQVVGATMILVAMGSANLRTSKY